VFVRTGVNDDNLITCRAIRGTGLGLMTDRNGKKNDVFGFVDILTHANLPLSATGETARSDIRKP